MGTLHLQWCIASGFLLSESGVVSVPKYPCTKMPRGNFIFGNLAELRCA